MSKEPSPLRDYQAETNAEFVENIRQGKKRGVIVMPTGCHAKGQFIRMHPHHFYDARLGEDKYTYPVEFIEPGHKLLGADGLPRTVLHLCRGEDRMVRIIPEDDGPAFVVNQSHVLVLKTSWSKNWVDMPFDVFSRLPRSEQDLCKLVRRDLHGNISETYFEWEEAGRDAYYGFKVDGDERYVMGCGIVSHNSGKTRCGTDLAYRAIQKGKRVLWVAHRDELIDQAATRAGKDGIPDVGIIAASFANPSPKAPMQVASVGTLLARKNFPPADLILLDECFPAGTLIDGVPIEQIREGDMVRCFDHKNQRITSRPVVRLFRKKAPTLINVSYYRSQAKEEHDRRELHTLRCTANHPIFTLAPDERWMTEGKYRAAETIEPGHRIVIGKKDAAHDRDYNDNVELAEVAYVTLARSEWDPVTVFNIEVEEHHNYFANTVLVHNCHHYSAEHWSTVIKHYEGRTIAGLTATPAKKSGAPLGDFFEFLVHGPQPADLIAAGHLVPCEVVAPPKPMKGGIAWDPFDAWKRFSGGRRTMAFYATVEEAKMRRDQFVNEGIPAATINQSTPPDVRKAILQDLSDGRIKVVTNVYVLTEGTDVPPVEVILVARTCGSASMVIQMVGRGMRPSPATGKKKTLWIDLPGCVHKFGTMDCERIYSLHGDEGLTTAKKSLDNLKCRKCGMIMPKDENGACVGCGYTAPPKQDEGAGPEIKNVDISFVRQMQANPGLVEAYARLVVSGRQKGYKDALAAKRFFEMYGQWPEANWLPWLEARIFPLFQTDRALPSNFTRVLTSAIGEIAALEVERGHPMEPEQKKLSKLGASAVAYADTYGFRVFPLEGIRRHEDGTTSCTCGNPSCRDPGKHPLGALGKIQCPDGEWREGFWHATDDVEKIRAWWEKYPWANIGIRTGSRAGGGSGVIVIDVDMAPHKDGWSDWMAFTDVFPIEDGPSVKTGSGGMHHFLEYPEDTGLHIGNRVMLRLPGQKKSDRFRAIDIRGNNGYVVAAPSLHKSGREYAWDRRLDEKSIPEAPDEFIEAVAYDPDNRPTRTDRPEWEDEKKLKKMEKKARDAVQKMPASVSGQNGHGALWNAVLVVHRGFCIPEDMTYDLIMEEFNSRCIPPWSSREINHKIEQAATNSEKEWGFRLKEEAEKSPGKTKVTADAILDGTATAPKIEPWMEPIAPPMPRPNRDIPGWNWTFTTGDHTDIAWGMQAYFERDGRILCHDEGEFANYDPKKGVWNRVSPELICTLVSRLSSRPQTFEGTKYKYIKTNGAPNAVLSILTNEAKCREDYKFEEKPHGIAFKNGFVTVEDGEIKMRPHAPENYAKFAHDFDFDEKAECPMLDNFLEEALAEIEPSDRAVTKQLLQEFAGACLMGLAPTFQQCLVLYGKGGNGKSQFLDAMRAMFPPGTTCSLPPQRWGEDFRMAALAGKLANFVDELPKTGITQSDSFKSVVDGSVQDVNVKFRQPFTMRPVAGHIFACNDLPISDDQSLGFWRRPIVVPMERDMSKIKGGMVRSIGKIIAAKEKAGIVAWAIRGAAAAQRRGGYITPDSSKRAINAWRIESDILMQFLRDPEHRKHLTSERGWKSGDMYQCYREWANKKGQGLMAHNSFGKRLGSCPMVKKWHGAAYNSYSLTAEAVAELQAEEDRLRKLEEEEKAMKTKAVDEAIAASPPPDLPEPEDELPGWLDNPAPPPGPPAQTQPLPVEAEEEMPEHMREEVPDSVYEGAEIVSYAEFIAKRVERERQDELGGLAVSEVGDEVDLREGVRAKGPALPDAEICAHAVEAHPDQARHERGAVAALGAGDDN